MMKLSWLILIPYNLYFELEYVNWAILKITEIKINNDKNYKNKAKHTQKKGNMHWEDFVIWIKYPIYKTKTIHLT